MPHQLRSSPLVDADACFLATSEYYLSTVGGFSVLDLNLTTTSVTSLALVAMARRVASARLSSSESWGSLAAAAAFDGLDALVAVEGGAAGA